ncbi:MAG: DUF1571 domain-containing protein [Planctomycetaceae bacterium]
MQNVVVDLTRVGILSWCLLAGVALTGVSTHPALAADDAEDGGQKVHPLVPAIAEARKGQEALQQVKDYEATFAKTEVVRGRPYPHEMRIKLRSEPFSVYLKFIDKAHEGREVLYVTGKNNGKMKAHEGKGIKSLVTVDLNPNGPEALAEGRYPITNIGMMNMVTKLIERWEGESKFGEIDVEYYPEAKIGKTDCLAIMVIHPIKRNQFKFHKTVLYLDKQTNFPIRLENYDFPQRDGQEPPLVEQYQYTNIEVNKGLTDQDFDYRNKQYNF